MISRNLLVGFVSVAALTLTGVGAAAAASAHAAAHAPKPSSVRPALDESQGCWYRVDQDNIYLYSSPGGGTSLERTARNDIMVSSPLDETGSGSTGWEYVMDVSNEPSSGQYNVYFPPSSSGWIQKQYMVFLSCSGPKYGN